MLAFSMQHQQFQNTTKRTWHASHLSGNNGNQNGKSSHNNNGQQKKPFFKKKFTKQPKTSWKSEHLRKNELEKTVNGVPVCSQAADGRKHWWRNLRKQFGGRFNNINSWFKKRKRCFNQLPQLSCQSVCALDVPPPTPATKVHQQFLLFTLD